MKRQFKVLFQVFGGLVMAAAAVLPAWAGSICYGKVNQGHIDGAVQLPEQGPNFAAYSSLGVMLGRTYVHSTVKDILLDAYKAAASSAPGKYYVYAETGWEHGGRFRPHHTHQNGLSVDFMVPVLNPKGESVSLPANPANKFGYAIDFDEQGKSGEYTIDFEAMAEHLYQLDLAAKVHGSGLALVIFDPRLRPLLAKTKKGAYLEQHLNFMKGQAWVRHDQHYHVDFSLPCKP
jgi:penicillin-insensitive murein endopeptidase